jgi:hypothetical protein
VGVVALWPLLARRPTLTDAQVAHVEISLPVDRETAAEKSLHNRLPKSFRIAKVVVRVKFPERFSRRSVAAQSTPTRGA